MGGKRPTTGLGAAWAVAVLCVVLSATPLLAEPVASRADATARAVAYTGFAASTVTSVARRVVSDPSSPVLDISSRHVWEVVFGDVSISAPGPAGKGEATIRLPSVRVWLDAQTGALVKAATPPPAHRGLSLMVGKQERELLSSNRISLTPSPTPPAKPLAAILGVVNRREPGSVMQAKEMVAYFGLLTDTMPITEAVYDQPAWLIFFGGVSQPFSSSGPDGNPNPPGPATEATEELTILDATTGEPRETWLAGKPR